MRYLKLAPYFFFFFLGFQTGMFVDSRFSPTPPTKESLPSEIQDQLQQIAGKWSMTNEWKYLDNKHIALDLKIANLPTVKLWYVKEGDAWKLVSK